MSLDSALVLRKLVDNSTEVTTSKAKKLLNDSNLIKELLIDPKQNPKTFVGLRAIEWRLLELSEIPYTYLLEKVGKWVIFLVDRTYTDQGFSLTGQKDGIMACHNAMITSILLNLKFRDKLKIDTGINWILKYQSVARNERCTWSGKDLYTKWGGCMKSTPCFYGVIKSMKALTDYKKSFGGNKRLEDKLREGLEYILKHSVYKKLSNDEPIEKSILENFYPFTYKSNLIEILHLLKDNNLLNDGRCTDALEIIKNKKQTEGLWYAETSYMKSAWVNFDELKKPGLWISNAIENLIEN